MVLGRQSRLHSRAGLCHLRSFVFPPDVGTANVRSACFVTGAALEGQVVGEKMGTDIEGKIALAVVPGRVVFHLNGTGITVICEAMFLLLKAMLFSTI